MRTLTLLLLIASAQLVAIPHARAQSVEGPIGAYIRTVQLTGYAARVVQQTPVPASKAPRSVARKVIGAAVGGFGGFFAGGYLGAAIDGSCGGCDDPGLKGALIGAPIGTAVGAILGYKFLF